MGYELTSAAERAACQARFAGPEPTGGAWALARLLHALASQAECRAARLLATAGIDRGCIEGRWPELVAPVEPPTTEGWQADLDPVLHDPEWLAVIDAALGIFADHPQPLAIGTEHLLVALASLDHEVAQWLARHGFSRAQAEETVHHWHGLSPGPLELPAAETAAPDAPGSPGAVATNDRRAAGATTAAGQRAADQSPLDEEPLGEPLELEPAPRLTTRVVSTSDPSPPNLLPAAGLPAETAGLTGVWRVIDAEANRAAEALRVVEDYVRFVLDDRQLTSGVKDLRHELGLLLQNLGPTERLAARETQADVGTTLAGAGELERAGPGQVAVANWKRAEQALRSLAEFAKVVDPEAAAALERLRYRAYTWERALLVTESARARLASARLYVLIDGRETRVAFERLAASLVESGVDVLQLRDKRLADGELVARARLLRRITAESGTLFVMNDRPDLAVLAQADGVHVGQDELSVKDCRTVVGPQLLVGVSTHTLAEAQQAVLDGADYLGVGPVFPTPTKQFAAHPGIDLLRAVAAETRRPAFAIGGITAENLAEVLRAGFSRVAISHAVLSATDPAHAARELQQRLTAAAEAAPASPTD